MLNRKRALISGPATRTRATKIPKKEPVPEQTVAGEQSDGSDTTVILEKPVQRDVKPQYDKNLKKDKKCHKGTLVVQSYVFGKRTTSGKRRKPLQLKVSQLRPYLGQLQRTESTLQRTSQETKMPYL